MRMMARFQTLFNVAVFFKKRPDKLVPNPGIIKIKNKYKAKRSRCPSVLIM